MEGSKWCVVSISAGSNNKASAPTMGVHART